MSKQSVAQAQGRNVATPVTTPKLAHSIAELVLKVLDKTQYRGGKVVEYREPESDGIVRIHRDENGRVHFRTPRNPEVSIRLEPSRSKSLLSTRNVRPLEVFFENHPLVLAFLDPDKLRGL
jgi:hypothetical protein